MPLGVTVGSMRGTGTGAYACSKCTSLLTKPLIHLQRLINCLAKTRSGTRAASKTSGCDELRVYGVIKTWDQGSGHQFDFYRASHDSISGCEIEIDKGSGM